MHRTQNPLWTVLAGALGCAVGAGIVVIYVFPIFAIELCEEFKWDRSAYSDCLTSFLVATGIGTVALGRAIGRWNVRLPSMIFIAGFACMIGVVGLLLRSLILFCVGFALLGIGGAAATAMPYAIAVSGWFDKHRGLALGAVNTGAGLGAALGPQYARLVITHYEWRSSFLITAIVVAAVTLPGLAFLVRDPAGVTLARIDAGLPASRTKDGNHYLGDRAFWLIAILILALSMATVGVMGSLVPFLKDHRISGAAVANVRSIAGIASWSGRLLTGYLLDRLFAPYLAAAIAVAALVGLWLLFTGAPGIPMLVGAGFVGATLGAEGDLVTFLVGRYFQLRSFSRAIGAMWVVWAWGAGLGSYLAGASFRYTHSYNAGFGLFAVLLAISG